jgi:prevent-host-death family protein
MKVTVHAAKTNLSKLIEQACAGEEVIISRGSQPVARLVPVKPPAERRVFGRLKGQFVVGDEFFEPLSDEELAAWDQ